MYWCDFWTSWSPSHWRVPTLHVYPTLIARLHINSFTPRLGAPAVTEGRFSSRKFNASYARSLTRNMSSLVQDAARVQLSGNESHLNNIRPEIFSENSWLPIIAHPACHFLSDVYGEGGPLRACGESQQQVMSVFNAAEKLGPAEKTFEPFPRNCALQLEVILLEIPARTKCMLHL